MVSSTISTRPAWLMASPSTSSSTPSATPVRRAKSDENRERHVPAPGTVTIAHPTRPGVEFGSPGGAAPSPAAAGTLSLGGERGTGSAVEVVAPRTRVAAVVSPRYNCLLPIAYCLLFNVRNQERELGRRHSAIDTGGLERRHADGAVAIVTTTSDAIPISSPNLIVAGVGTSSGFDTITWGTLDGNAGNVQVQGTFQFNSSGGTGNVAALGLRSVQFVDGELSVVGFL